MAQYEESEDEEWSARISKTRMRIEDEDDSQFEDAAAFLAGTDDENAGSTRRSKKRKLDDEMSKNGPLPIRKSARIEVRIPPLRADFAPLGPSHKPATPLNKKAVLRPRLVKETPIPVPKPVLYLPRSGAIISQVAVQNKAVLSISKPKPIASAPKATNGTYSSPKSTIPIPPPARRFPSTSLPKQNISSSRAEATCSTYIASVSPAPFLSPVRRAYVPAPNLVSSLPKATDSAWKEEPGYLAAIAYAPSYVAVHPSGITISSPDNQTTVQTIHLERDAEPRQLSTISSSSKDINICSVKAGKVRVTLEGTEFSISKRGFWRVRGGEECFVRHRRRSAKESIILVVKFSGGRQ